MLAELRNGWLTQKCPAGTGADIAFALGSLAKGRVEKSVRNEVRDMLDEENHGRGAAVGVSPKRQIVGCAAVDVRRR